MNRDIRRVIVHCSDSPDEQDIGLAEIDSWHKLRGFTCQVGDVTVHCGYHYVICRDGTVEAGRPESVVGAHCKGQNSDSIGICLIGREDFTVEQRRILFQFVIMILSKYALTSGCVFGHYEFETKKTCPNIDMGEFRKELKKYRGEP